MRTQSDESKILRIAIVCHEAVRTWAGLNGDPSILAWQNCESWQREAAINGVKRHLDNPAETPADCHASWMAEKTDQGWRYGKVKDAQAKTHPCLVPFQQLPEVQQKKDLLFGAIVDALK